MVHELPGVGQNLRDHPNIRVPVKVKDDFPLDPSAPRTQAVPALHRQRQPPAQRHPDHAIVLLVAHRWTTRWRPEGIRFTCILELSVGSGHLRLASTDPHDQPALNYNYFQEEFDLSRMREAVRVCVNLLESDHYKTSPTNCWIRCRRTWKATKP